MASRAEVGKGTLYRHFESKVELYVAVQNGLAYMRERARLEATFEGDALEGELRALREEYFAHEAPTIEADEREGFLRFERPRVYGRN